jgi:hypothetical protein
MVYGLQIVQRSYNDLMKSHAIHAEWDPEARVWVATSDDVPGLVTESESLEALDAKLKHMVPELLESNGIAVDGEVPYELHAHRSGVAPRVTH